MGVHSVLFQSLEEHGWAVSDQIVLPSLALRNQAHQLWQQGFFKPASVGRRAASTYDPDLRGDAICWLNEKDPAPPCAEFLAWAELLRRELNRYFRLSLRSSEFHFARYEPGRGYARHIDQHHGTRARKISLVLYLNEGWNADDGGELCLYAPENQDAGHADMPRPVEAPMAKIVPQAPRLAMFLSDRIPHEVLPARRVRWSLTGWFRDDAAL